LLEELRTIWERSPDLRLCQIVESVAFTRFTRRWGDHCIYNVEDDIFLRRLRLYGQGAGPSHESATSESADGIQVTAFADGEHHWVADFLVRAWGAVVMATRGKLVNLLELPGFIAEVDGDRVGLLTYLISNGECEVTSLNSTRPGLGVGTALLKAIEERARAEGCRRLWLITTNDNIEALRFYQRRGFELVAVHRGAVDEARATIKPQIPLTGNDGIPLRDEIELEIVL
jgi:GNAT superfamily N-acetyltransferase